MLKAKIASVATSVVLAVSLCPSMAVASPLQGGKTGAAGSSNTLTVQAKSKQWVLSKATVEQKMLVDEPRVDANGDYVLDENGERVMDKVEFVVTDAYEYKYTGEASKAIAKRQQWALLNNGLNGAFATFTVAPHLS